MKKLFIIIAIFVATTVATKVFAQKTILLNKYLRSNIGDITLWDGKITRIYGITDKLSAQPAIPASTIICEEGDTVIINALAISQGDHHTIHLHGLDVDTRNDGDPMTSFYLQHMQDTTYTFVAKHAGTYIYHCHVGDVVHVQMGMYGLIIVKAKGGAKTAWTGGPSFDKEYGWLTSEIDKSWHDTIPVHEPNSEKVKIPKYVPDYFLVNGKSRQQIWNDTNISIKAVKNEKVYVRLANIGFSDNQVIFPKALNAKIIDSDGRPLPAEIKSDTVMVSPGERYGVMLTPNTTFIDSILVNYLSLNTSVLQGTEKVPVNISPSSGIKTLSNSDAITVFPNPANDYLTIINSKEMIKRVSIYNILGEIVYCQNLDIPDFRVFIPSQSISDGLYIIQVETSNTSITKTVIIRH